MQATSVPHQNKCGKARAYVFTTFGPLLPDGSVSSVFEDSVDIGEKGYILYGRETCPETQRKHLQGMVIFPNARPLTTVLKQFAPRHIEMCKSPSDSVTYCKKEGEFVERGVPPNPSKQAVNAHHERKNAARRKESKERYAGVLEYAMVGDLEAVRVVEPALFLQSYSTLKRIAVDYMKFPPAIPLLQNLWVYGPSGTGKSHFARLLAFPGAFDRGEIYLKACNHWWDGYSRQPICLMEELSPDHQKLAPLLKQWADIWSFSAEIKGGTISARPLHFIVTSNYSIEEVFGSYHVDVAAIKRRFTEKFMETPYVPPLSPLDLADFDGSQCPYSIPPFPTFPNID